MAIDMLLAALGFTGLIIATFTDLKTREVPNWLSYGMIFAGIGLRLFKLIMAFDWAYLIYSAVGFGVFVGIAYLMFYAGQWGGGDSKILMAIGAIFPTYSPTLFRLFNPDFSLPYSILGVVYLPFLAVFMINLAVFGAVWGLLWSLLLVFKHKKKFVENLRRISSEYRKFKIVLLSFVLAALISAFFIKSADLRASMMVLVLASCLVFYLTLFIKAVEKSCMIKTIKPGELTEGDWITKDITVGGKAIYRIKDLGVSKKQIKNLVHLYNKGKIKKISVKEGVPFTVSFLIALIVSTIWGNVVFFLF